jgi:hypothetical protein
MTSTLSVFSFAALIAFSNSAFAGIALSRDAKAGCDVYRITTADHPPSKTEELISDALASGFSLRNANIDFDSKTVRIQAVAVVRLGFNDRPAGAATWISPGQPNFNELLNSLNRTVFLYSKVCVAPTGQIIWAE